MEEQMGALSTDGQLVTFFLSKEEFGIPIEDVQEIVKPSAITKVPNAPGYVQGIANLRGNILPVMDLRKRLGMEVKEEDQATRVIVLRVENRITGLVVDSISDVLHVNKEQIQPPPQILKCVDERYVQGVARSDGGKRLTLVLATKEILPEKRDNQDLSPALASGASPNQEEAQRDQQEDELIVTFNIGQEEFGIDIMQVQEVLRVREITEVPKAPPFVKGITSLREMVLPIVDLAALLGLDKADDKPVQEIPHPCNVETTDFESIKTIDSQDGNVEDDRRIVVIDLNGILAGLLVDSVSDVLRVSRGSIDEPPGILRKEHDQKLKGVARLDDERLIMILDLMNLIPSEQRDVLEELGESNEEHTNMNREVMDERQVVCFRIEDEEYGIDIMKVQEIVRISDITSVPNAPEFVEGIVNLRGNVLPVIDMRMRFGIGKVGHSEQNRIVVVDISGKTTGIIVDSVSEVLRIPGNQIEPPPEVIRRQGAENRFINGIGKLGKENDNRIIMLIDVDSLLNVGEKKELGSFDMPVSGTGKEISETVAKTEKKEKEKNTITKKAGKQGTTRGKGKASKARKAVKKASNKGTKKK